tara:strand:- start:2964 stop:3158 length:195 start_codon:yes stop_codon:yes gene_type:complete
MKKSTYTNIHNINTFQCTTDNEIYLCGENEHGEDVCIVFDAIEILQWLDIDHIKEQTTKYIKNL